jgi:hypothetical protein
MLTPDTAPNIADAPTEEIAKLPRNQFSQHTAALNKLAPTGVAPRKLPIRIKRGNAISSKLFNCPNKDEGAKNNAIAPLAINKPVRPDTPKAIKIGKPITIIAKSIITTIIGSITIDASFYIIPAA